MKIAHLSDLHISHKSRPDNIVHTKRLLEHALNKNADHIVITGDLIHLGDAEDYYELRRLFMELNLLDASKLTLVIGNHDIFGGVHLAEDIIDFPRKAESTDFDNKVREFRNYFLETFENSYFPVSRKVFPNAKIIGDVVFFSLNSISRYSKVKNLFASTGRVNKTQREILRQLFNKKQYRNKKRIVLMHHHFKKHIKEDKIAFYQHFEDRVNKLRKKKRLLNLFKKSDIDLIMHGHQHESLTYSKKGIQISNAAGCIDKNEPGELKFNMIHIHEDKITVEVEKLYSEKETMMIQQTQQAGEPAILVQQNYV